MQQFIEHLTYIEDARKSTVEGYRKRLGQFHGWLAGNERQINDLSAWREYWAGLKERSLSPYTRRGHYYILARYGDWLVDQGVLDGNPMRRIKAPKLPQNALPKAAHPGDIQRIIEAARLPRDRAIVLFIRDTGCRASEVIGMRWRDVDLETGTVAVTGKGDKHRKVFILPVIGGAISVYRETLAGEQRAPDAPVWWSLHRPPDHPTHPLTTRGLAWLLKRLGRAVKAKGPVNPHAWRHAFGRDTTKAGIPTVILRDLMGHSDIKTTQIYTSFDDEDLREAHRKYSPLR
jgi:site-specific recombinase XerD